MNYREITVELVKLNLDKTNPRHPPMKNQKEIIDWMTDGNNRTGDKLFNLAKDIIKFGLNPAEKVIITKEVDDSEYIVMEGNRRVTAIKLLNNPNASPTEQWQRRFKELVKSSYDKIKSISCVFYPNEEDAYHFIELKHLGESNGAGTVPWDPEQKARHAKRLDKSNRNQKTIELIDSIRSSDLYAESTKKALDGKFPITTLERLVSDVEFRDFLGLEVSDSGELEYCINPEEAIKPISKVIEDLGSGKKNVRDVINKEKRLEYMNSFPQTKRPDIKQKLDIGIPVKNIDENITNSKARAPRYQIPTNRKYVVLTGTNIPIDPRKYNRQKKIYDELKKLPLKNSKGEVCFPNAAILLIRLFLETSVGEYIKTNKIKAPNPKNDWKDISLVERIKVTLADLESKNKIDPQRAKVVKKVYSDPKKLCYPGSLNDFAHNTYQVIAPSDVTEFWDSYVDFLIATYGNM